MDYKAFYDINADFRAYVDKYCDARRLSVAEALQHKLVQYVGEHYAGKTGASMLVTSAFNAGCGGAS